MAYEDQNHLAEVWRKYVGSADDVLKPRPPKYWSLPENISTFLDAGCGRGSYVAFASSKGARAIGIDIVSGGMKIAKKNSTGEFLVGDVRALPIKDDYFDYVVSYGVVEHFKETDKALREIFRVLKPGGTAVISVPGLITLHWLTKTFSKAVGTWGCGYERSFTPWGFKKMLENENLKVVDVKIAETGIFDFPKYPSLAKFIGFFDRPLARSKLGGRFIFAKCQKGLEAR